LRAELGTLGSSGWLAGLARDQVRHPLSGLDVDRMLVTFEGRVLCSLPLGVIGDPVCDPAADEWAADSFSPATGR
jgi:hypothetical protein